MLNVNRQAYGNFEFKLRFHQMKRVEMVRKPEGKRYAVCLIDSFDLLTVVWYLREHGGSILILHADTPLESAIEKARQADCAYLLYHKWDVIITVSKSSIRYEPSVLQYSSGTTSAPTLIIRTWIQIETEIAKYNQHIYKDADEQPIILVPVSHSFGLISGVLASVARGAHPTIVQDKNPKFALHLIKTTSRPIVYTVPFIYNVLDALEKGEFYCNKVVTSGSPLSEGLLARMKMQTNEVFQQYGCTEAGCISVCRHPVTATDVGTPLGHIKISILSDNDNFDGDHGEIMVTCGPNVIATRDLGRIDPHTERLHIMGRMDDLINVSGLKVIPSEVESVIERMPGIRESIVVKMKHKVWGEAIRAIITAASHVNERDIRSWCMKHLPPYKVPSLIELVEEIPRMASGKVSRKQLQEQER